MFTPKARHSSTVSWPRPAYLAALLLVISLLAAFNPGRAFAMPRDPIDPPPIGGEEEPYETPAGGFAWSVPARFGLDANRDGMIDYHWRDSNAPADKNTYEPAHIYPIDWPINLDGCRTASEEEAGTSSNYYVWHIHGQGPLAGYTYQSPANDHRCRFQRKLPAQGDYTVELTIYDSNLEQIAPPDLPAYTQTVYIKDYLIVTLGDSFASGEGNPDIPQQTSPNPWYYITGIPPAWNVDREASWQDERCHRSAIAGPSQAALELERNDPHTSVTFLSFACSGATVGNPLYDPVLLEWEPPFINLEPDEHKPRGTGILGRYRGQAPADNLGYPADNSQVETYEAYLPSQIDQLRTALTPPAGQAPRTPDALIMSGGGNDIYFADIAMACIFTWDCFENARMHESPHNGGYLIDALVRRALGNSIDNPPITLKGSYDRLDAALDGLTVDGVNVKPRHIYITEYPDMGRDDNGNWCRMLDDVFWPNPIWAVESWETGRAMTTVLAGLNGAVKYRADMHGWTYVDGMMAYVDDPDRPVDMVSWDGKGHGYCASDNWVRRADEAELMQGPISWYQGRYATKGLLHPAERAHQVYKERILHYLLPDLAADRPTQPPAFRTSTTVGTLTNVAGSNGWFIKSCTGGTGACEDKVVLKVTAAADQNSAATLQAASSTVNGAAGCPSGVVCTGPTLGEGNKTASWTYEMTADGIYRFGFTARDSLGQATDFSYQVKADLHNPQLTVPTATDVDEGASVALQAQAVDAAGGIVDVDWDLDNDGKYETADEEATFSAADIDGPADITIGVRAKDVAGRIAAATATVSVGNVAPTAAIDAVTNANEGDDISLGSTVVDPGYAEQLTYAWQVTSYGVEVATSDQASFTFTAADSGPYDVTLTVADDDGGQATATHTVYVANVAPAPGITGAPAASGEGTAISLTASATDPSSADQAAGFRYSWTVTKGMDNLATGTGGTFSFTPDDNGAYTVTLEALDKDGDTGTATQDISVGNVAPTLGNLAANVSAVDEGGSVTLTGGISDPGGADSFSLEIDWGDGSPAETVNLPAGSGSFSVAHTYADDNPTATASDLSTISVKLSDDDGGSDTESTTVTVNNRAPAVTIIMPAESALYPATDPIDLAAAFTDAGAGDTWSCVITWDDGTTAAGTVANGVCTASKTYAAAGIYSVQVKVADDDGGSDTKTVMIVVYDPSAGFVTGAGHIDSPAGAYTADPSLAGPARFALVSKYQKGAKVPSGQTQFEFKVAGFKFNATAYEWLVVAGPKAQYKGTGTVNGGGSYGFLLTVTDGQINGGGGVDKFRIKIWNDAGIVYDNRLGASDDMDGADPQPIASGAIVIHK